MGLFFFFNDTATTEIYTLSLHDALPICRSGVRVGLLLGDDLATARSELRRSDRGTDPTRARARRSEEHTSELQSRQYLVCRLLLEKKQRIVETIREEHTGREWART